MTADEPVAGVPRLCARRADCTRPRGHGDECGPDRADTELADLRAEVERLRYEAMLRGTIEGIVRSSALSATEAGQILRDVASLRDASAEKRRAEKAEAERDDALARLAEAEGVARTNAAWVQQQHAAAKEAREQRDALQRQVDAVRALGQEWRESTATGHPDCAVDEDCVGCAADDLDRALDAVEPADQPTVPVITDDKTWFVEPADQPHPTPEAGCGHPNHGAPDHDCAPFAPEADECSTCGGSLDSPPCSLNRELGISGHTGGGGCQKAGS